MAGGRLATFLARHIYLPGAISTCRTWPAPPKATYHREPLRCLDWSSRRRQRLELYAATLRPQTASSRTTVDWLAARRDRPRRLRMASDTRQRYQPGQTGWAALQEPRGNSQTVSGPATGRSRADTSNEVRPRCGRRVGSPDAEVRIGPDQDRLPAAAPLAQRRGADVPQPLSRPCRRAVRTRLKPSRLWLAEPASVGGRW